MNILHSKIGLIYPRYKSQLILIASLLLGAMLLVVFSWASNTQNTGLVAGVFSDNTENSDNAEFTLLTSILPTLTNIPTLTFLPTNTITPTTIITNTPLNKPTNTPTTKPAAQPTAKPTVTLKPSPTNTNTAIPTPTKTIVPTPTLTATVKPTPTSASTNASCDLNYSLALLAEINKYRSQNGKPLYTLDSKVSVASCNHSYWMKTTGIFSHTGINGTTAAQRCTMVGTTCNGENITSGGEPYLVPATVVLRWSGSPPHDANMLGSYTHIGIGRNGNYVTVDFAF